MSSGIAPVLHERGQRAWRSTASAAYGQCTEPVPIGKSRGTGGPCAGFSCSGRTHADSLGQMKDMNAAWVRVQHEISHVARQAAGQIEHRSPGRAGTAVSYAVSSFFPVSAVVRV